MCFYAQEIAAENSLQQLGSEAKEKVLWLAERATAMVWEADNVVQLVRQTMGETDPIKSPPGTLRGDLGLNIGRNLVHGSDSPESARREIDLFFEASEILSYERDIDPWVTES